jgi:Icc-related predicted phosphoesterase
LLTIAIALLAAAGSFEQYQVDSETTCAGKSDQAFETPETWTASGHTFTVSGARATVKADKPDAVAHLGLLSAIKDFSPETKRNLELYLAAFKRAGVKAIIVDGDSAYGVDDQDSTLAEVFSFLGDSGIPVYAVIGNSESRSAFNRGLLTAWRKNKSVINLDLVRRVEGDGFTLVSLPGYFDKRFIAETSGCNYKPEDAQELIRLVRGASSPVVLVTHGPPRQDGKGALDVTVDGKNVGDPDLAQAIADAKIRFGVFGHILEAGGRATDLEGKKPVRQGAPAAALYLNPGPAFADPWVMADGRIAKGMAAILTIKAGKGEWTQVTAAALEKGPRGRARKGAKSEAGAKAIGDEDKTAKGDADKSATGATEKGE